MGVLCIIAGSLRLILGQSGETTTKFLLSEDRMKHPTAFPGCFDARYTACEPFGGVVDDLGGNRSSSTVGLEEIKIEAALSERTTKGR